MDCKTARLLLAFRRPWGTELEESEAEALKRHLAECPECGAQARADEHLGRAVRAVAVPEGLRDRIFKQLEIERDRQARPRRLWWAGGLTAAAAVLLALWFGWQNRSHPRVEVEQVAYDVFQQIANPLPGTVEEWFQGQGVHTVAPRDFNYALLRFYGLEDFEGKRVPMLLFTQGKDQARVYILSQTEFNLKDALANPQGGSGGCKVDIRPCPTDPRLVYLIVYTTDSLDTFL
ncbi:MAG: hypothetical protein JO112_07350, partial [Planctomycetes bacterium]|nr:hypothetical protein [Planctomycetota bacterium]